MIHPTASIHPGAVLDPTVQVGAYAVIDEHVSLGPGVVVGPHVYLTGHTTVGPDNRFHAGCVIGDAPQDLKYAGAPTRLRIGTGNVFREHVTVHRANQLEEDTVIGSECFFMANCHVGHNSILGDRVIVANGALLGGHVSVNDRAFISGNALIHQFVRIGTLALLQGGAGVSKDVPPYTVATGINTICGLNLVGLRRAGLTAAERLELKQLYRALFRSGSPWRVRLTEARSKFSGAAALRLIEFVAASHRGVCADTGQHRSGSGDDRAD